MTIWMFRLRENMPLNISCLGMANCLHLLLGICWIWQTIDLIQEDYSYCPSKPRQINTQWYCSVDHWEWNKKFLCSWWHLYHRATSICVSELYILSPTVSFTDIFWVHITWYSCQHITEANNPTQESGKALMILSYAGGGVCVELQTRRLLLDQWYSGRVKLLVVLPESVVVVLVGTRVISWLPVSTGSGGHWRNGWKVEARKLDFLGKELACSKEACLWKVRLAKLRLLRRSQLLLR